MGVLERYSTRLPLTKATPSLSLCEGSTPLIEAPTLAALLGITSVHLKFEGLNPTGSFKDRGMVVAVAKAVEEGATAVVCASTGNTSASAAAYAARIGIKAVVVVPQGKISPSKLLQARMHGAKVVTIAGNFDQALTIVRSLAEQTPICLVNSVNPYRIEGQKTAAFEIVDDLGQAPSILALPVGNAGNITAYWKGFCEDKAMGRIAQLPTLVGGQAAGAAPLVLGHPVTEPTTVATAIRIGNPASWESAIAARDESGGVIEAVTDDEILAAQRLLASTQGVFCEPASAAGVAVLISRAKRGLLSAGDTAVCVLTGHGLKDPTIALEEAAPVECEPTVDALCALLDVTPTHTKMALATPS